MRWNATKGVTIQIQGHGLEEVGYFVYLQAIETSTGMGEEDTKVGFGKAAKIGFCLGKLE